LPAGLANGINVNKAASNARPGLDNVDRRRGLAKGLAKIIGNMFIGKLPPTLISKSDIYGLHPYGAGHMPDTDKQTGDGSFFSHSLV